MRHAVSEHYLAVLRPLLTDAKQRGELRADADIEAFLALLLLLLPHVALAPHHPGLDPVLGLDSARPEGRAAALDRLVETFRRAFGA